MFCEKCGTKLEDGSLFCDNCGAKVSEMTMVPQVIPVVPKKPMEKLTKLFIFEVIALVLLAIGFYKLAETRFSSENVAKNYAKAKMAGDMDEVYDMLNLPSSELLTKDMFLMTQMDQEAEELVNYEISNESESRNSFSNSFRLEYMTKGNVYSENENIQVVKQREKQMLFFDKWEITPDSLLTKEVILYAPADVTLKINGIDISTIQGVKTEESYGNIQYTLPVMFNGTYTLEASAPARQTITQEVVINNYYSNTIGDMVPSEESIKELADTSYELQQSLISSAFNQMSYEDFVAANKEKFIENIDFSYSYNSLYDNVATNENRISKKAYLEEIITQLDDYGVDGETGNFFVRLCLSGKFDMETTQKTTDWWTGETIEKPYNYNWNHYGYFTYQLINGEWVLSYYSN